MNELTFIVDKYVPKVQLINKTSLFKEFNCFRKDLFEISPCICQCKKHTNELPGPYIKIQ